MKLPVYQIDAFTDRLFAGNPACVVPLETWLPDALLLQLARENAVAETAFLVMERDGYRLRWFTPEIEMDLCGHATLAAAHALKTILHDPREVLTFYTASGELQVTTGPDGYTLDFPSRMPVPANLPQPIAAALSLPPLRTFKARDYVLVYPNEQHVRDLAVDRSILDRINLDPGGVAVTAPGDSCDFVSRFFTPQASILEDPVTGSAHCSLVPFWARELGKDFLLARQVSARGGTLHCQNLGKRVLLRGQARTYAVGHFWTD
ncbi:PhzF family phenazine biosynthesis protein [Robiginitalea sp. M366]|uniref:PhzF family phenazine biosynthesis protein n=1 Tax=Robiginitalea aestuariiviva TaxID=3036903 RepID=UPI00240E8D35|nr:PhzF family phenazine biosynthesis protein [Robiginitalea aestuariiviva]MDG1572267.1 PhzF family phenazine biosynthesis protein [Robiginitalea aestuariiviva]